MLLCSAVPEYVRTYESGGKGEWRNLHSEEPRVLNSSSNINRPNKTRAMRRDEHVAHVGGWRGGGAAERGKGQLGRPGRRSEENINPYPANVENMVSS